MKKLIFITIPCFILLLLVVAPSHAVSLSQSLSGKILLQVQEHGEAWYIYPDDLKRYYLGRPADAFSIMRELGLGISEASYNSFNGYAPFRLSGKILLRVEANGEAYYVNPVDLKMHYLGRPADAFQIMRELGLGITNADLDEIKEKIFLWFQTGNTQPITQLQTKQSIELENNRIGIICGSLWSPECEELDYQGKLNELVNLGIKRFRTSINRWNWANVCWDKPENSINPSHDDFITNLAGSGITITYNLIFWDKENMGGAESLVRVEVGDVEAYIPEGAQYPRFKTEEEIQRYLDFVQFIVHHFKDRIQTFAIWNEPDIGDCLNWIEVPDYINLVKRAVPVIRQEYPEAKIQVGGTTALRSPESYEYFFSILNSDIMPLVDVIYWIPGPGFSPDYEFWRDYYYNYPSLVENIKDVASAHGFEGEYIIEGLTWCTPGMTAPDELYTYSDIASAKYYARGIVMHLGMDVTVTGGGVDPGRAAFPTVQNLCTIMAGAEPIDSLIEIQSEATDIKSYSFSLSNGDKLIALWTDGIAVDEDPGVNATLTIPNFSAQKVTGIDVLEGYQQNIVVNNENKNLIIQNLLVRDYPLILQINK